MRTSGEHFHGAKAALFLGYRLVTILRDDDPGIPYPNLWDFPGGGREGEETPFETLAREVEEEISLTLQPEHILWRSFFPGHGIAGSRVAFFVARMPAECAARIVLGDEGQEVALMTPRAFFARKDIVPSYRDRMRVWRAETGTQIPF